MPLQKGHHLNYLLQRLPPGLLVDSQWLQEQGLSRSRIHDYVERGWLERLRPRVYRRPAASATSAERSSSVTWELAVVSAQALVDRPFHVGGPTALDLLGLSHFLDLGRKSLRTLRHVHSLRRLLQRLAVEACNVNDWTIPFNQMTIHLAAGSARASENAPIV